jgi:tetratricopeptide (TPR) repeat protein
LEKAAADINESISIDPYNAWAYRNKGLLAMIQKDHDYAERLFQQALKTDDFVDKIYYYMGMNYLSMNKRGLACVAFNKSEQRGERMVTQELISMCKTEKVE